jgi:hypothetical protein
MTKMNSRFRENVRGLPKLTSFHKTPENSAFLGRNAKESDSPPSKQPISPNLSTIYNPFMQNEPNFRKSQVNVRPLVIMNYERKSDWTLGENEPKTNPIKANLKRAKMNVNSFITKDYRKKDDFAVRKNKPNSKPISKTEVRSQKTEDRSQKSEDRRQSTDLPATAKAFRATARHGSAKPRQARRDPMSGFAFGGQEIHRLFNVLSR